ncbi:hypothetical protein NMV45_06120 [Pasteurella multocida]|uniref:DUF7168 domain-containing protein n=1 Tax=Pasteurella multocida TaxID=747 RepID=UPI002A5611C2|nr:hypothetical protein [Pasteurella multocida]MDY0487421.1 hypothetical protein [Pasteurella multocida]MDY0595053.1 hypothetical protein [Pasteurella multocida]MDY0664360.1 hypothetical protein [Pasteurella multocida]MDY0666565.1 hypothetical protein [Pasteurella multocida]
MYRKLQQTRKEFIATQNKRLKRSTLICRADNYCLGWVQGVYGTIKNFVLTPEEEGKIQQYSDELHKKMNLREAKVRKIGDTRERNGDDSGLKGYMDGKKVKLNHGVNGQETLKISNQ